MTAKTEPKPPDPLEFRQKTQVKIQKLFNELTKITLYGATLAELDDLREIASIAEDIGYEMGHKTLERQDRELYSTMGDLCKAVERVWHGMEDIPDLAPKILELIKPHCPAALAYCCKYDDIPVVGELVTVCGHFSGFCGCLGDRNVEGSFVFQKGGEVTVSFPTQEDWQSYYSGGELKGDIVLEDLEVAKHPEARVCLIWQAGKSTVFGRAPK